MPSTVGIPAVDLIGDCVQTLQMGQQLAVSARNGSVGRVASVMLFSWCGEVRYALGNGD
ncbi:hypothetical protein [Mycobacterium sp. ITM-2016-00318]|uniref:hypothetical protein n=1 Tax=Mycobacterium sp. ITM-2016-00318 TaxID=2099693 RepID=UPI001E2E111D|nr:hypothetical protein [Mycobacterium sp. ITM-2016-00318]WNG95730.1 hypothetical protein C6A82_004380 [Mycobacterium sp. ITM-2016-00318]